VALRPLRRQDFKPDDTSQPARQMDCREHLRKVRAKEFSQQTAELGMRLWFGKYKGCLIQEVPDDGYLVWMADAMSSPTLRAAAQRELDRRMTPPPRQQPAVKLDATDVLTRELVEAGFRTLARRWHPDMTGGDLEKMQKLNLLMEKLRK
jgi:hypothetical protein